MAKHWFEILDQLYKIYTSNVIPESQTQEDFDLVLFDLQLKKDNAKEEIRSLIGKFIETDYIKLVDRFITGKYPEKQMNVKIANDLYRYMKSMGKDYPGTFGEIKTLPTNETFSEMFDLMRKKFYQQQRKDKRTPIQGDYTVWESGLLHWGEHIKTEIQNDSFDEYIMERKLFALVATIACLEMCVQD